MCLLNTSGPHTIVSNPISLKIPASVPNSLHVGLSLEACKHNDIKLDEFIVKEVEIIFNLKFNTAIFKFLFHIYF